MPAGDRTLRVVFAGFLCPGSVGERMAAESRANEVVRAVRPFLASADLRIVQWETRLARVESPILKSGPNLNGSPGCAEFTVAGGFDVALLANNHIGDQGGGRASATRWKSFAYAVLPRSARGLIYRRNGAATTAIPPGISGA